LVNELSRRMKKKTEKDKKQKVQRVQLKSWELLQEKVGINR